NRGFVNAHILTRGRSYVYHLGTMAFSLTAHDIQASQARLIAGLRDDQLARLERGPLRSLILRSLPIAMPLMFSRKAARGLRGPPLTGTIELAIRKASGKPDVFAVAIDGRRCRVRRGRAARPGASIEIGLGDLVRMGSGSVDPAAFLAERFADGRIALKGD